MPTALIGIGLYNKLGGFFIVFPQTFTGNTSVNCGFQPAGTMHSDLNFLQNEFVLKGYMAC